MRQPLGEYLSEKWELPAWESIMLETSLAILQILLGYACAVTLVLSLLS